MSKHLHIPNYFCIFAPELKLPVLIFSSPQRVQIRGGNKACSMRPRPYLLLHINKQHIYNDLNTHVTALKNTHSDGFMRHYRPLRLALAQFHTSRPRRRCFEEYIRYPHGSKTFLYHKVTLCRTKKSLKICIYAIFVVPLQPN